MILTWNSRALFFCLWLWTSLLSQLSSWAGATFTFLPVPGILSTHGSTQGFCMLLTGRPPCIHQLPLSNVSISVRLCACVSLWLSMQLCLGMCIYSVTAKPCALLHKPTVNTHLTVYTHHPAVDICMCISGSWKCFYTFAIANLLGTLWGLLAALKW